MELQTLRGRPELEPPRTASRPPLPRGLSESLLGALRGSLGHLSLSLFSLRLGLLDWCLCLKQAQQGVLGWLNASFGLALDFFFFWAQNALLAATMALMVAWQVRSGAREVGWREALQGLALDLRLAQGVSWLQDLLVWVALAPLRIFFCLAGCLARGLEATFQQAIKAAKEVEEELQKEEG